MNKNIAMFVFAFLLTLFFICNLFINKNNFIYSDVSNQEFILKAKASLFNNIFGKKTGYYYDIIHDLVAFYYRQWLFNDAEYYQKIYLYNIDNFNNVLDKQFEYLVLSDILLRQKKYIESEKILKKALELQEKNSYSLNLDEEFVILYFNMRQIKKMESIIDKNRDINKTSNFMYYFLLKDYMQQNFSSVKNKINYEMLYSTHKNRLEYFINVPYKYLNLLVDEIYRNSLRKILFEILIQEKDFKQAEIILSKILNSEEKIYGYYSPENLCNCYNLYLLNKDNLKEEELFDISKNLLYFKKYKNNNNLIESFKLFCKK